MDSGPELPSAKDFARIETDLFARINVRYRRQVVRHRLVAVAAVLVLAGAGVAAGTAVNTTKQSQFAYCFDGSTTGARVAQLALPTNSTPALDTSAGATKARADRALFICKAAWSGGVFSSSSSSGPFPVPRLQVCIRDDLSVAVFRKPDSNVSADTFCDNLGLTAP
jgi:hypothetical protein